MTYHEPMLREGWGGLKAYIPTVVEGFGNRRSGSWVEGWGGGRSPDGGSCF